MADSIANLLEQIAFLQGGGQMGNTPIQRGVFEKSLEAISPLLQTAANLKGIRKEQERNRLLDVLLGEKVRTAQAENQTLGQALGTATEPLPQDVEELKNLQELRSGLTIAPGASFQVGNQNIDDRIAQLQKAQQAFEQKKQALANFPAGLQNVTIATAKNIKDLMIKQQPPQKGTKFTNLVRVDKPTAEILGLKEGETVTENFLDTKRQQVNAAILAGNQVRLNEIRTQNAKEAQIRQSNLTMQRQSALQAKQQMINLRANLVKVLSNEKVSDDVRDQARQQVEIIDQGFLPTPNEVTKPFLFFFNKKSIEFKPLNTIRKVLVKDNKTGQQTVIVLRAGEKLDPSFTPLSGETPINPPSIDDTENSGVDLGNSEEENQ